MLLRGENCCIVYCSPFDVTAVSLWDLEACLLEVSGVISPEQSADTLATPFTTGLSCVELTDLQSKDPKRHQSYLPPRATFAIRKFIEGIFTRSCAGHLGMPKPLFIVVLLLISTVKSFLGVITTFLNLVIKMAPLRGCQPILRAAAGPLIQYRSRCHPDSNQSVELIGRPSSNIQRQFFTHV